MQFPERSPKTEAGVSPAELLVVELPGIDSEAVRALWQFLFGVDLVETLT